MLLEVNMRKKYKFEYDKVIVNFRFLLRQIHLNYDETKNETLEYFTRNLFFFLVFML